MNIAAVNETVTISSGVDGFQDPLNVAEVRENSARDVGWRERPVSGSEHLRHKSCRDAIPERLNGAAI
jgi:hypothetical protein